MTALTTSDDRVGATLRSAARLVAIEAPAGCGKTHQAAEYCRDALNTFADGRLLVLTHTHAARSEIASRVGDAGPRIEVRTLDGFISEIAETYHSSLKLPSDVATWARATGQFSELSRRVRKLIEQVPFVAMAITIRYPVVICDEHQDSSEDQHAIIALLHKHGSLLRMFGDPMQVIFSEDGPRTNTKILAVVKRWERTAASGQTDKLDHPHRWRTAPNLGKWILQAREALASKQSVSLTAPYPAGLNVIFADNTSGRRDGLSMTAEDRKPIDEVMQRNQNVLVLAAGNPAVRAISAFWAHRYLIWEGHVRNELDNLLQGIKAGDGNSNSVGAAFVEFVCATTKGFGRATTGKIIAEEISDGCAKSRQGHRRAIQQIAEKIVQRPNYQGAADALSNLRDLVSSGSDAVEKCKILLHREFDDAIRIGRHADAEAAYSAVASTRNFGKTTLPRKCISTIHKAKGLQAENVLMLMCDSTTFADTEYKRRLLYVGLSRPTKTLTLVVNRTSPSPLFTM